MAQYNEIYTAIEQMHLLDPDDGLFIDDEAAHSANLFASLLYQYNVPIPQLFSHGGDTVVFKWLRDGNLTLYVTVIDSRTVALHRYAGGTPLAAHTQIDLTNEAELVPLMTELGGWTWRAVTAI